MPHQSFDVRTKDTIYHSLALVYRRKMIGEVRYQNKLLLAFYSRWAAKSGDNYVKLDKQSFSVPSGVSRPGGFHVYVKSSLRSQTLS